MLNPQFYDALNFLGKVNLKRFWNGLCILVSYWFSKYLKINYIKGMPLSISFEPTTQCNLKCPQCPSGLRQFSRPTGFADTSTFQLILNELEQTLLYLIFYFQGEPYLHKDLFKWIEMASKRNVYTATSTNAHYLTDENCQKTIQAGLDRLIISLDGVEQNSYAHYRVGGTLEKVLKGVRNLVAWKKKLKSRRPFIILQFIVFKHNEHEIEAVRALGKALGIDYVAIKTAQIYDYEQAEHLIPAQERYARYKRNEQGNFVFKNSLENSCWKMWHSCVLTQDGRVVPCCFDKDASHQLGQITTDKSFKDIWLGDSYKAFRAKLLESRKGIDICTNCTEGTRVWA